MSEVEFTGSAFYTTECNFSLVSSSNQTGGVSINIPPSDNFILRSRFNINNASNLSFAFTDTSNTISTYIRQSTSSILLSSNEAVITTCNFVPVNNSNYEIAIRRRLGETKLFINDQMIYDHTTPFTFDELNGKFEITGFSRCNLPSTITVDDVEITPITTYSNLTEFVADVKISSLYCDNIVSASSNVIINTPITTNTINSSNISTNSVTTSNISFGSNQIININSNSVIFNTPLYSSNVTACNIIFSATQSNLVDNVWTVATSNVNLGTIPQRIYNVEYGLSNTSNKAIWGSNSAVWGSNTSIWGSNTASWTSNALQEYIATDSNGDQTLTITNTSSSTQAKQQTGKDGNGKDFIKWLFSALGSAVVSTTITMAATGIIINGKSVMDWGAQGANMIQNTLSKMTVDFANNLLDGVNAIKTTAGKYVMNNFTRATGEQGIRLLSDQIRVGAYSIHIDGDSNIIAITDSNSSSNVYFGLDKCYMMSNLGIGLSNPSYLLDVNGDIYSSSNMYEAGQLLNIRYAPSNHTHDFSTTYAPSNAMSNWDWGSNTAQWSSNNTSNLPTLYAPSNAMSNWDWGSNTALWSSNNTSNLPTLYAPSNAMSNWDWGSNTALWSSNNTSNLPTLYAPSNAMSNWDWGSNTAFWSSNALSNFSVNATLSNYGLKTQTDWTSNSLSNYTLTSHTHATLYAPSNAMSNWNWGSNTALWSSNALSNYALIFGLGGGISVSNLMTQSNVITTESGTPNKVHINTPSFTSVSPQITCTSGARVGIHTTSPAEDFHIQGNALIQKSGYTGLKIKNSFAYNYEQPAEVVFDRTELASTQVSAVGMDKSGRDFFVWVNGADRLNIDTTGKVGIGTKTPSYLLDVNGDTRVSGDLRVSGDMYWTPSKNIVCNFTANSQECSIDLKNQNTYTSNTFQIWSDKTGLGTIMACRGDTGFVGVRTTTPRANLEVKGNIGASNNIWIQSAMGGLYLCNDDDALNSYWRINHGYDEPDNYGNLNFYLCESGTEYQMMYAEDDNGVTKRLNFTGCHRVKAKGGIDAEKYVGLIVVANGKYSSLLPEIKTEQIENITINEALPVVELCKKSKDKRVFGVIAGQEELTKNGARKFNAGYLVSCVRKQEGDDRIEINSLGEGAVWVCDTNGNFENGDYITTSSINGYGEKQDNEYVCNYTVGKITCDVDWSDPNIDKNFQVRIVNGHKCAFVGCIYMCG